MWRNRALTLSPALLVLLLAPSSGQNLRSTASRCYDGQGSRCLEETIDGKVCYKYAPDEPSPDWDMTADDILGGANTTFPKGFAWGSATAAYQIEGATDEDGRGPSMWDVFVKQAGAIANGDNADIACDHYHRYKEDIALMKALGQKHYRYSISWTRIFPTGTGEVNLKGVDFYKNLTSALVKAGITPAVTLYHWDLPQALQEEGGWLNADTADAFAKFADVMFEALGGQVKRWFTINEPWTTSISGYGQGAHAPGLKDMVTNPYKSAHNQLLAHAAAVKLYRTKYQAKQKGQIGIALSSKWKEPFCQDPADVAAAQRTLLWYLGWFADPIYKGDYPEEMRMRVGERLPVFTEAQKKDLKGSADFFALNHYSTNLVQGPTDNVEPKDYYSDINGKSKFDPTWQRADAGWLDVVPWGMRRILNWVKVRYDNPPIFVTENGVAVPKEAEMSLAQAVNDTFRVQYLRDYVSEMWKAIHFDKVDVRGYYHWSIMDNFEWSDGYKIRFGLVHVDYTTQKRTPKKSAQAYKEIIKKFSK